MDLPSLGYALHGGLDVGYHHDLPVRGDLVAELGADGGLGGREGGKEVPLQVIYVDLPLFDADDVASALAHHHDVSSHRRASPELSASSRGR